MYKRQEQYYRDNRLNPIHEGTEAIHGLDILGRKVLQKGGLGYQLFNQNISEAIAASGGLELLAGFADDMQRGQDTLNKVTETLLPKLAEDVDLTLANATIYLDLFGRVVASWIWLKQAIVAATALGQQGLAEQEVNFYRGKIQAARYYLQWELPQIEPQAKILMELNPICYDMQNDWF